MGIKAPRDWAGLQKLFLALAFLILSSFTHAETIKLGLHYDIATDGHGFDLHKVGDTYVMFLYTYDDNGDPEWFLGVGTMVDGVITGALDRYTYVAANSPPQTADPSVSGTFTIDYRFAAVQGACNDGVDRSSATQLSAFAFKLGNEEAIWCTQYLFGGVPGDSTYYGGVWYSLGDEGYGFSMSQQDQTGISIVYYYDADFNPVWALAVGDPAGEMVLENYTGYCRTCPLMDRIKTPAGTLTNTWDAGQTPGSGTDTAELVLTYPSAPGGDWDRSMNLARITDLQPTDEVTLGDVTSLEFYSMFNASQTIEGKCIACHVSGGVAAGTRLVYTAGDDAGNLAQLQAVLDSNGEDYILNKARGVAHGGGVQMSSDSDAYKDLQLLFGVIDGTIKQPQEEPDGLFANVGLLSWEQTLRRAAIILAGRLPSASEIRVARTGTEAEFRATLRNVLKGDGFHQFLVEGANDRLLTEKWINDRFLDANFEIFYPELNRMIIDQTEYIESLNLEDEWVEYVKYHDVIARSLAREPLELIAYIVERDRSYQEIVTATYTMVTPLLSEGYASNSNFVDVTEPFEWRVGHSNAQLLQDETVVTEDVPNRYNRYISGGIWHEQDHAGVLNAPALLARYPSTATNRNRARARWTYYFFLGVDIEKAAARTTDPVALADTNNPTLNNPACTVCHQLHDPVAGAFQNHGDVGFYRDQWGGMDSLAGDYKYAENSLYQEGDTWYRDMRAPGFNGKTMPNSFKDNSLQWLGKEIADDPRFGPGTVKFWWPAFFARAPLEAPEEASDPDFDARLAAFEAQNGFIEASGAKFIEGIDGGTAFNLKDLFVEIIMSPWFRASGLTGAIGSEQSQALTIANVGAAKLLTPEQLDRKTRALTGRVWDERHDDELERYRGKHTAFNHDYFLFYGGLDSDGITQRTTEITSVMSSVTETFAAEVSCGMVVEDFNLEENQRLLFDGITRLESPTYEGSEQYTLTNDGFANAQEFSTTISLLPGDKFVQVDFLNDWADNNSDRNLYLNRVVVNSSGGQQVAQFDLESLNDIPGASVSTDCSGPFSASSRGSSLGGYALFCQGNIRVPLSINTADDYTIVVTAIGEQAGPDLIEMLTTVSDTDPYGASTGANSLRQKLKDWHYSFLGEDVAADGPEIAKTYELLVETWQPLQTNPEYDHLTNQHCHIQHREFTNEEWHAFFNDPQWMMATWRAVLTYFLTDYRYLHE